MLKGQMRSNREIRKPKQTVSKKERRSFYDDWLVIRSFALH